MGNIYGAKVSLTYRDAHMAHRSLVVFETFIQLFLRSTKVSERIKNQPCPDGFPIIFAKSLLSPRQCLENNRITFFQLPLSKKSPAQVYLARSGDVVAPSFAHSQHLFEIGSAFFIPLVLDARDSSLRIRKV